MIKLTADNVDSVNPGDILYNWKTHVYARCQASYDQCNRRLAIGHLTDDAVVWWTTFVSLPYVGEWRLVPDFRMGK